MIVAKLVVSFNKKKISEHLVSEGDSVTVGRHSKNDIHISNLAISSYHAEIQTNHKRSILRDLGSMNGSYVNNKLVGRHILIDGDVIKIGKYEITFIKALTEKAILPEYEIKPKLENGAVKTNSHKVPKLILKDGAKKQFDIFLTKRNTKIVLAGKHLATIARKPAGYYLIPYQEENDPPPIINGLPIVEEAHVLRDSDKITISGVYMSYVTNT